MRFIIAVARLFGTHAVSDLVQALEGDEEEIYDAQSSPEVASIAADERKHAEIWKRFMTRAAPDRGEFPKPTSFAGKSFAGGLVKYRDKSVTSVPTSANRSPASTAPRNEPVPTTAAPTATTSPPKAEAPPTTARVATPPPTDFTVPVFTVPRTPRE